MDEAPDGDAGGSDSGDVSGDGGEDELQEDELPAVEAVPMEPCVATATALDESLAELRESMSTAKAVATELKNATNALEEVRSALKGRPKAMQQAAFGPLEAQRSAKADAWTAAESEEAAARRRVESAVDAQRAHWEQWRAHPSESDRKTVLNLAGDAGVEQARRASAAQRDASSPRDGTSAP
jgi:hypothetical protein